MSRNTLVNFFETNWAMAHHYKWSIAEMEDMIPFEFEIYVDMTREHIKKLEESKR